MSFLEAEAAKGLIHVALRAPEVAAEVAAAKPGDTVVLVKDLVPQHPVQGRQGRVNVVFEVDE